MAKKNITPGALKKIDLDDEAKIVKAKADQDVKNNNAKADRDEKIVKVEADHDKKIDKAKVKNKVKFKNSESDVDSSKIENEADIKNSKIDQVHAHEHSLEMHGLSKKEKWAIKRKEYIELTSTMNKKQKLLYLFDYYKWYAIIPIILIAFFIYLGHTIYNNSKPIALSFAVLNLEPGYEPNFEFEEDFREYCGYSDNYVFNSHTGYTISYEYFLEHETFVSTGNSTDYNLLAANCNYNEFDVVITNLDGLNYCGSQNIIKPIKGYFDAYAYEVVQPYMVESINSNKGMSVFALDISDTDFAKNMELGYDDVYLAFASDNEKNKKNAKKLVEYIFNISLSNE